MLTALVPSLAGVDACRVTTAPDPPFIPPVQYRPSPYDGEFWYGTNALWASLPVDGIWRLPRLKNGGFVQKLFLWQEGYDPQRNKEYYPQIVVVLKRLDGDTQPITSRSGTNAHFDDSWAMLRGIFSPMEGCWEITSSHDGHKLIFVLSIQGPD